MSRRLRASGWASELPRVVGERSAEADILDEQLARTSVPQRKWHTVPSGPWPCETCSRYMQPGSKALRRIVAGEAVYRHATCSRRVPFQVASQATQGPPQAEPESRS